MSEEPRPPGEPEPAPSPKVEQPPPPAPQPGATGAAPPGAGEPLPTAPPPAAPPGWGVAPWPGGPGWGAPPAWPAFGAAPPPAIPPPPPPPRDRLALAVVLVVFGGLFLVFLAFLLLAYGAVRGEGPRLAGGPRIGVVEIKGEIGLGRGGVDSEEQMKVIKRYLDDEDMKAVVVRIDSPGGAVGPSQEIYDELRKLAEQKTVVCSMGGLAASGGFYIAMACPHILAEPGTLTGSIGVISQFPNVKGLVERFDVKVETLKSGKLKDSGNPFRDMTPEDRSYWQALIDQVYQQFVAAVAESRQLEEAEVRKFADGRVLTGQQAHELGLVDELGNFNDAVDAAREQAGLAGEPRLVYPPEEGARFFEELFGGAARSAAEALRSELHREATAIGAPGLYYLSR